MCVGVRTRSNPRALSKTCVDGVVFQRLFAACLTSQQHGSVSQGRICSEKFTYCYTEIEVAGQTYYLTQSQFIDTGPTSPSADPKTPGAWQGSHWSPKCLSYCYTYWVDPEKFPAETAEIEPGCSVLEADALIHKAKRGGVGKRHVRPKQISFNWFSCNF